MKNCHIQKFVHCFRYYFLICIRDHSQLFWCLAFPVLLSTLFYFAFGNLTRSENFNAIPVAIVIQDNIPSDSALVSLLRQNIQILHRFHMKAL